MGDWSSGTYIASQVFVAISYILLAATYFIHQRTKQLATSIASATTVGISWIFLGAWNGVALAVIAICRDITSSVIYARRPPPERNINTRLDWWLLALWLSLFTISAVVIWQGVWYLFAYFATMTFAISIWQKDPLVYRALGILVGIFWIVYNIAIKSDVGLWLESVLLLFVIAGFFSYWKKHRKK
ncbi:MAG: YgjV family protein [Alphaproteobacteria bacterium]|nr:YgjV family protein [Alphaproteobacteria bacterium]